MNTCRSVDSKGVARYFMGREGEDALGEKAGKERQDAGDEIWATFTRNYSMKVIDVNSYL